MCSEVCILPWNQIRLHIEYLEGRMWTWGKNSFLSKMYLKKKKNIWWNTNEGVVNDCDMCELLLTQETSQNMAKDEKYEFWKTK